MARYSKTLTPAAQLAFLAALRGGALVVAAARGAGVAVSTLYCRRARDPVFAAAWAAAAELSAGEPGRRLRFGARRRRRYLGAFEASCNTSLAAAETGVHRATVHRHVQRDPGFAGDCRSALWRGYDGLERELGAEREARARRWASYEITPRGTMTQDFDEQMRLLAHWERTDGSIGPRTVRYGRMRRWTFEEAITLLARRLESFGLLEREDKGGTSG